MAKEPWRCMKLQDISLYVRNNLKGIQLIQSGVRHQKCTRHAKSVNFSLQKDKHGSAETSRINVRAPKISVNIPKIKVIASGTLF